MVAPINRYVARGYLRSVLDVETFADTPVTEIADTLEDFIEVMRPRWSDERRTDWAASMALRLIR